MASNPGAAAANGEDAKVSFLPDIEIEPDLKKEDLDKGLAELEEKLTSLYNPKIKDLDVKIDSVKEDLKPRIDKLRDRFDAIKLNF